MNEEEKPLDPNFDQKKRTKKNVAYVIIFLCLVALVLTLIFSFGDISKMGATLSEMFQGSGVGYLIAAIACAVIFFLLYPIPLMIIGRKFHLKSGKRDLWLIGNSEHFYNGVTPSSVGGQPFQAYGLHQGGDNGAEASGVILMNYINIVICSNIFGLVSLIFYPYYIQGLSHIQGLDMDLSSLQWIAVAGIILNAVNLVFFCLLSFSKTMRRFIMAIVSLLLKPKWLNKRFGKFIPKLDEYLEKTQATAKAIIAHWKTFLLSVVSRLLILSFCYAVPFFLMLAMPSLEIHPTDFWLCFFGNAFATVCVAWFPTPGAVGAGEIVGAIVLGSITVKSGASLDYSVAQAVSLLNRGISFYFVLILSFVASLIFEIRVSKKETNLYHQEKAPSDEEAQEELPKD
ncbi:MAG: flippase-like domain-containing protein [Bacilli bacterium]|nr:flippase-like domain-containing protein [Bacilli bacterium]